MNIPTQPTLPAEGTFNDTERLFIEESPVGLWPENQDSNFGQVRRVLTQPLQEAVDFDEDLFNERFIDTADGYLGRWEDELGIPQQLNKTDVQRRSYMASRLKKGGFTRARLIEIIEGFIIATFGESVALTPAGVPLDAGGVPLFADAAPVTTLYRIYEDTAEPFKADIRIVNTVTPDLVGLDRELAHFFPAGYNFEVVNFLSQIQWYVGQVRTFGASAHYALGGPTAQDSSGAAHHGTLNGSPVGQVSLVNSAVGGDGSMNFDGSNDWVSIADAPHLRPFSYTMCGWVRTDVLPAVGDYYFLYYSGDCFLAIANLNGVGVKTTARVGDGTGDWADIYGTTEIGIAPTTYFLACTYDGGKLRLYVDGVEELSTGFSSPIVPLGEFNQDVSLVGTKYIGTNVGQTRLWDGIIDEVSFFGHALTPAEILKLYNTGKNIL